MKKNQSGKIISKIISACALAVLFTACPQNGTNPSSPSMDLVLSFSSETSINATKAVLTYGSSSDETVSETLTSSVSSNKASFSLSSDFANSYGYLKVYSLQVYSGSSLVSASTSEDLWFKFVEDSTKTINYTLSASSASVSIDSISVELDENFLRGFDASQVDFYETEDNRTWADTDGTTKDFFEILAAHGINTVRLRIWNDPTQFSSSVNNGMNDLDRTISMAKRVKDAGLNLMLDFHYSDTWADPARQIVPNDWKDLTSADSVASALSEYTTQVLTSIKEQAGITPTYVQIGNEINNGMMTALSGKSSTDNTATGSFSYAGSASSPATNLIKYLSAGVDAVHNFDSSIKTVIHLASSKNGGDLSWFFERISDVDYDVIGLSYYPWESSHGTISALKSNISTLKSTFNKDVIVVECSAHWKDDTSALSAQNYTYQHMIDPDTSAVYSDLETSTSGTLTYVKGSVQNQANVLRHIIEETAQSGGIGVFAWGGDLYGNYKWGMFDSSGIALASLDVFNISSADSDSGDADTSTGKTVSLVSNQEFTMTGTNSTTWSSDTALESSAFNSYSNISKIDISVSFASSLTWGTSTKLVASSSDWIEGTWSDSVISFSVTDSTQISYITSNGVIIGSDNNGTGYITVSITYSE